MMVLLCLIGHFAPFGSISFAWTDGHIQYLDFFSFFKDVLHDRGSIVYSLTSGLGNSYWGNYAYYLASPFNLLIVFFDKEHLNTFFTCLVILKIAMAAFCAAIFFEQRFGSGLSGLFVVLLAESYAFMQYDFSQASNIMWLDGVYMLPLMLLGVYRIVQGRGIILLALSTALSILFNWYTGGINCLFSFLWFIWEMLLSMSDGSISLKKDGRKAILLSFRYGLAMASGVLMSSFLFIPTVVQLHQGVGASFDWSQMTLSFRKNPLVFLYNYKIGGFTYATDVDFRRDYVSLYAGSLAGIGVLCAFMTSKIRVRAKCVLAGMLIVMIFLYSWQPFFFLFSLLKEASSYYYRYGYLGSFIICFCAGMYFSQFVLTKQAVREILKAGIIYIALLWTARFVFDPSMYTTKIIDMETAVLTTIVILSILLSFLLWEKNAVKRYWAGKIILLVLVMLDLSLNASIIMKMYSFPDVNKFIDYTKQEEGLLADIRQYDRGTYRISQTAHRENTGNRDLSAQLNEPSAFGYMGIGSYTSVPVHSELQFLDSLGYRMEFQRMNIVNTSVLPADSLLGVKYIMSPYPMTGLSLVEGIPPKNGKRVYENPFALPLAFTASPSGSLLPNGTENPYVYTNQLYSWLLGRNVSIYKTVQYHTEQSEQGKRFVIDDRVQGNRVYADIPWEKWQFAQILLPDGRSFPYAQWLSAGIFYVPQTESGKTSFIVSGKNTESIDRWAEENVRIYMADLSILGEAVRQLNSQSAEIVTMQNGYIRIKAWGLRENERLIVTIPYVGGWKVMRNGQPVIPEKAGDCLFSIPLANGDNDIVMEYELPDWKLGMICSGMGIFLLLICIRARNKRNRGMVKSDL